MPVDFSYRLGAAQNIAPAGSSAASAAFATTTYFIRVASTAAVNYRVDIGTPTAVTTDAYLPANWVEVITVSPGQKLAAIGTATVNITEVS